MSYADAMRQDDIDKDDNHWEHLRCMSNIRMEDCNRENVKVVEYFVDDEVVMVEIDKEFLGSFANLIDRGVILFFTGKIPFLWRVKQWLRGILQADCVQDVYAGPLAFMRLFWYHKSIKRNCSINCHFFMRKVWFILFRGGH